MRRVGTGVPRTGSATALAFMLSICQGGSAKPASASRAFSKACGCRAFCTSERTEGTLGEFQRARKEVNKWAWPRRGSAWWKPARAGLKVELPLRRGAEVDQGNAKARHVGE